MELMKLLDIKGNPAPVFVFSGRDEFRKLLRETGTIKIFHKPSQLQQMVDTIAKYAS